MTRILRLLLAMMLVTALMPLPAAGPGAVAPHGPAGGYPKLDPGAGEPGCGICP